MTAEKSRRKRGRQPAAHAVAAERRTGRPSSQGQLFYFLTIARLDPLLSG
jgi:hypothetical protein